MNKNDELHDEPVIRFTRKESVVAGFEVDVSKHAREADIKFPVFFTSEVYSRFVKVPEGVIAQDEAGRIGDILTMLRYAMRKARAGATRIGFALYIRNDNISSHLVSLVATCDALDIGDPRPAISVMLPEEE